MRDARRLGGRLGAAWVGVTLAAGLAVGCSAHGSGPPYHVVSPPIAFAMLRDSPEITILDLRSRAEFEAGSGHLRGAVNIPLSELAGSMRELEIYRDTTFLVYCDGDSDCGGLGMEILQELGYGGAVLMAGGLSGWKACGYGTVGTRAARTAAEG